MIITAITIAGIFYLSKLVYFCILYLVEKKIFWACAFYFMKCKIDLVTVLCRLWKKFCEKSNISKMVCKDFFYASDSCKEVDSDKMKI